MAEILDLESGRLADGESGLLADGCAGDENASCAARIEASECDTALGQDDTASGQGDSARIVCMFFLICLPWLSKGSL